MSEGKYSVELFKEGGEGAGQEEIIDRHDNLVACAIEAAFLNIRAAGHAVRSGACPGEKRSAGDNAATIGSDRPTRPTPRGYQWPRAAPSVAKRDRAPTSTRTMNSSTSQSCSFSD